jgi:drug/metabolite transporter (DMT)-like permease
MQWIIASLVSALFLGVYQLCTKHAVRDNAVLPVLFLSNLCGAGVWIVLLVVQSVNPEGLPHTLHVASITPWQHGLLLLKSLVVGGSWVCSYFAVKHLPVSIGAPIRATSPLWILLGAVMILGERPGWLQWVGVLVTLGSFVGLSLAGRREGIHFHRDKWVGWMIAGTLLGSASGLYDKYLLGTAGFRPSTVQAWFAIYLTLFFLPLACAWKVRWWPRNEFYWRWSIPLLALSLLVADFVYFTALKDPEALIALVATLRRGSTLVAFFGGLILFKEHFNRQKLLAVMGVLLGIVIILIG